MICFTPEQYSFQEKNAQKQYAFSTYKPNIQISLNSTIFYASVTLLSPPPRRLCFHFVCLFVCYQDYAETTQPIFTKFGEKVAHWPRKKPLDFGGNPDHVMLGLGLK